MRLSQIVANKIREVSERAEIDITLDLVESVIASNFPELRKEIHSNEWVSDEGRLILSHLETLTFLFKKIEDPK